MILVDSSVWIDHFRRMDKHLAQLLDAGHVLAHPFVIGEIALGNLRQRDLVIGALLDLPKAVVASDDEVLGFVGRNALHGVGIGWIDAHLLASTRLTRDARLWSRDKRLAAVARRLSLDADAPPDA